MADRKVMRREPPKWRQFCYHKIA